MIAANKINYPALARGDFIRVRHDHETFRAGMDGMVIDVFPDGPALVFYGDRYNQQQTAVCVGPELWEWQELDMESFDGSDDVYFCTCGAIQE
jgi:hypothetical protein